MFSLRRKGGCERVGSLFRLVWRMLNVAAAVGGGEAGGGGRDLGRDCRAGRIGLALLPPLHRLVSKMSIRTWYKKTAIS
jgi:hypothetical protein